MRCLASNARLVSVSTAPPAQRSVLANGSADLQPKDSAAALTPSLVGPVELGRLQPFLVARLEELLKAVEQAAMTNFNDWLVRMVCN